jgi:hypothetical protein
MKIVCSFILFAMLASSVTAQGKKGKISGDITDVNGLTLPGVTVLLEQAEDTTVKQYTASGSSGKFLFTNVNPGRYLLACSAIGYQPYRSLQLTIDTTHMVIILPVIVLQAAGKSLKEVVITAAKPLVEHSIDRTTVNVDAMISAAASNALEVLGKSPGVYVDPSGNISLNGQGGVLVLIDDKPTYLSAQDLAAYLRSLPGGSLDKIELMTNPPAKYDAAGSAIINIKLKKNRAAGFNGSLSAGFNAGEYVRSNDALNMNYRSGKFNAFANISWSRDANFTQNSNNRTFFQPNGTIISSLLVDSRYSYLSNGLNIRTGLDYFAGPNTTIGLLLLGGLRPTSGRTVFNSNQQYPAIGTETAASGYTNSGPHWYNDGISLNFQHQFDKNGQSLSADLDHIQYHTSDDELTTNMDETGTSQMQYQLPSTIQIYSAKSDYMLPLGGNARFEAGVKSSWVTTDNNDQWFNNEDGAFVPDYIMSDHFIYKENINAAYASAQKQWKRWGIKGGLRLENTRDDGHQLNNPAIPDSTFTKNYSSLFPSFYLSYKLDTAGNNTLNFMYSRRLHRPNYQQLNPYLAYQNQYTYAAGNPYLNPNFYGIYQVSYAYKQFFDVSFAYINGTGNIYSITGLSGDVFITRPENFATNNSFNLHADVNITPVKGWDINASGLIFHLINKGEGYGTFINDEVTTGEIELFNSFHLDKNWSAELDGSYHGTFHGGQMIAGATWIYSLALQRKLFNGQGSLRLRADNLFRNLVFNNKSIGINDVTSFATQQRDTSLAGLSFQYSFGKLANARKRNHNIGAEDEQGRTN